MPNPWTVILKRLRVHQDDRGELQPGRAPAGQRPVDEGWWNEVLRWDRRLRLPEAPSIPTDSEDRQYRLDCYPHFYFEISCPCGATRRDHRNIETLMEQLGRDMNTVYLARHLIDCKARNKVTNNCRAFPVR